MSTGYAIAYALGLTPWERAGEAGSAALDKLFARAEDEFGGPGRALDLGCGSGMHLVALARRGWDATGVDAIGKAVRQARARAAAAGVPVTVVQGDVTTVDQVGTGYQLLLDVGCFHGLTDDQRARMGRAATAVAAPDAVMIMLAFRPGNRKPLPRGADETAIVRAFEGWKVVDAGSAPVDGMPKPLRAAAPQFYLLRR
ncbi:class I SAM-dependent methyltransferase [Amycolatopsis jejuensis]|uniref:class I SAM-dependent methyltransferase n=1 Tax=Amycolatopsis jejuensis TaxID=330084 RepID=UPI0005251463|nr:class I SAM-dependent methyltransferase [Amycolatopsis jejuensis]